MLLRERNNWKQKSWMSISMNRNSLTLWNLYPLLITSFIKCALLVASKETSGKLRHERRIFASGWDWNENFRAFSSVYANFYIPRSFTVRTAQLLPCKQNFLFTNNFTSARGTREDRLATISYAPSVETCLIKCDHIAGSSPGLTT